jgi:sterol desaturase/sphingolipid hydroxylase (fatty acid hydroxylase superfamily)
MGFAAHLRYHWMENVLYKPLKTIVVLLFFGFEPQEAFVVHFFSIAIGHLNHANLGFDYGPLKYVFNNPKMHIWHHAKALPSSHPKGMNFGISLSLWDYIFKTAYIPYNGRDIELGFDGDENFPQTIVGQSVYPFIKID